MAWCLGKRNNYSKNILESRFIVLLVVLCLHLSVCIGFGKSSISWWFWHTCELCKKSRTDRDAFWGLIHVSQRNHVLDGVRVGQIHSRHEGWQDCDAAFCQIRWPLSWAPVISLDWVKLEFYCKPWGGKLLLNVHHRGDVTHFLSFGVLILSVEWVKLEISNLLWDWYW